MLKGHRAYSHRLTCIGCTIGTALIALALSAASGGCSQCPRDAACNAPEPYCDQGKLQLQFLSPPGAIVTVAGEPTRKHQVASYGPYANRLEQNPEEFAVFNLSPGRRYEFKYAAAEGLPGVSVYGELEVYSPRTHEGRVFMRRAFVPIALPSEYFKRTEVNGPEIFPYRSETMQTAIDAHDIERLKTGDVVEKVFFIADLKDAEQRVRETEVAIAALERKIEYADARFRYAYLDFHADVDDSGARFWGSDKEFIEWEAKRQMLQQDLDQLQARLRRARAVLSGDRVLTRQGMMVLATEEVIRNHRDPVKASAAIGDVLLVMRIGGRHMHWGDPREAELVQEVPFGERQ